MMHSVFDPQNSDPQEKDVMPGLAVRLGNVLRGRRKTLGISMTTAAEAAGMSRLTWHRLEKGEGTVALRSLLAAAEVLGLELCLQAPVEGVRRGEAPPVDAYLPLHIQLEAYPQLRRLAWQVGEGVQALSPREALGLYERNWRHVAADALDPRERALIEALRQTFGTGAADV